MIKEKLEFISYIYESIPHLYIPNKCVFVYKKEKKWYIGESFETLESIENEELLLDFLHVNSFDIDRLDLFVTDIILNKCIVMKKKLNKAMTFVTEDQIVLQEDAWKRMVDALVANIEKHDLIKNETTESKPTLTIIE